MSPSRARGTRWPPVGGEPTVDPDARGWVVLAWTEEVYDSRDPFRPSTVLPRTVREPRAAIWVRRGSQKDVKAARLYAAVGTEHEDAAVFFYPPEEKDPLGRAKREILERADAGP